MPGSRHSLLAYAGIGPSYADFKYADPSPAIPGSANAVIFSPDESAIAIAHSNVPNVSIYQWSSFGFGAKYANQSNWNIGSGAPQAIAFSPDSSYFALLMPSTLYLWQWSNATGFGARFDYLLGFTAYSLSFSRSSNHIFVSGSFGTLPETGPASLIAIPYSSSGFGTAISPSTALGGTRAGAIAVHPTGSHVLIGGIGLGITSCPWTGSNFGTPSSISVASNVGTIDFSQDGTVFAFGSTSNGANIYNWSGGIGSLASTLPISIISTVRFSPAGDKILIGSSVTASPAVYRLTSYRFGSRYRDPDVAPAVATGSLRHNFSLTGAYIAVCSSAAPFIFAYKTTNQP